MCEKESVSSEEYSTCVLVKIYHFYGLLSAANWVWWGEEQAGQFLEDMKSLEWLTLVWGFPIVL